MPSQSRKHRGYDTQRIVADYLAGNGWPYAQSTGAGRSGTDVTGTPGLHWEVKARRGLNLAADLRQAAGHGEGLPILVIRLDGFGPVSIAEWPAVLRLGDLVRLLRQAGYGNPPGLELPAADTLADVYTED
jgi:hypothetical protein